MIEKILKELEQIAKAAKSGNEKEVLDAIKVARSAYSEYKTKGEKDIVAILAKLDEELSVWQTKLSVIWKEPIGRQGISKHATYWSEQLRNLWQKK